MIKLRHGKRSDLPAIRKIDPRASTKSRRSFIDSAIKHRACYVAVLGPEIAGYCVFDYSFFERGFVTMLFVAENRRRSGIGSALMRRIETACKTETLFTSTNSSNERMRRLLKKLGYKRSGRIDNLDEGDPELIYFKRIR